MDVIPPCVGTTVHWSLHETAPLTSNSDLSATPFVRFRSNGCATGSPGRLYTLTRELSSRRISALDA